MLYPLTFVPIFKERIWGGRRLAELYGKPLPAGATIGESWEISDRPGDASVIANGPFAGRDLRWLMENHRAELLGRHPSQAGLFPLLVKILDARQMLSLQVHPPATKAAQLGGEPKTEMWYVADAEPGSELYVGLRRGVTRQSFEQELHAGTVAECFHRVHVRAGDAMFLPSGRVHALGAGLVIFEVQQNSDTTYRVFDWNRLGLDGQPRALHLRQSLESIDFQDFEPSLESRPACERSRPLVRDILFSADVHELAAGEALRLSSSAAQIVGVVSGQLGIEHHTLKQGVLKLRAGQFCLLPASLSEVGANALPTAKFLRVVAGSGA